MVEYNKVNVKLSDGLLKKLKDAVKDNTGTTLRINLKIFNRIDLPHELLLTTRQKTKLKNAFNNNTSAYIKLAKIIQSGGFLGSLLSRSINENSCSFSKKCFSTIRNNSSCFSNRCRNSKKKYMDLGQQL